MKMCIKCKQEKPLSEFNNNKRQKDGKYYYCKPCKTAVAKLEYQRHKDSYMDRCYTWRKTQKGRDSLRKTYVKQREKFPEKYKARQILNRALRKGEITKPIKCEKCKELKRLSAHHDDYTEPLLVKWLCYQCHQNLHSFT